MLGNALIGLREGLEASLVVSILVAFLVRTDRRAELPKVWLGVGLAVVVSIGVTLGLTLTQQALTFTAQEALGGSLSIIAVGFVTWMIFWMRRNARTLSSSLRTKLDDAIHIGSAAVVVMAALAVGREGLETAVFFFAAAQAAGETTQPLIGFLAYGVHDLQEAGILPGLTTLAFDVSAAVPPDSWYGTLLKGIFNFSPQTTVLEAVVWVTYVAVVVPLFLRPAPRPVAKAPATTTA